MLSKNRLYFKFTTLIYFLNSVRILDFKKVVFGISFLLSGVFSQAQCAMCRASLESEGNASKAQAVNDGIVYLMVIPYVLVGIMGFIIYKMYVKKKVVSNN